MKQSLSYDEGGICQRCGKKYSYISARKYTRRDGTEIHYMYAVHYVNVNGKKVKKKCYLGCYEPYEYVNRLLKIGASGLHSGGFERVTARVLRTLSKMSVEELKDLVFRGVIDYGVLERLVDKLMDCYDSLEEMRIKYGMSLSEFKRALAEEAGARGSERAGEIYGVFSRTRDEDYEDYGDSEDYDEGDEEERE